jgi:transcriptional regulator with XRE-family HTH domain
LRHLHDRYVGNDPERVAAYDRAVADAHVARQVHQLRTEAGLSQRELAARVGTTASVICRLEDADYDGHSLAMLRRVAAAVGKRVEVRFVPAGEGAGDAAPTPTPNKARAGARRADPRRVGRAKKTS